jgi:hypothetical protein
MNTKIMLTAAGVCLALSACGGGGGGDAAPTQAATGTVRISITDAPVDDVSVVNVQFGGVTLKPQSGERIEINFDTPKDIDLLTLTGGRTTELLPDTTVPAGRYNWVQLAVNAEFDNVFDSYAMTPTGQVELRVPSNTGLKLVSGFTVTQNQTTDLIIDWDLRKALSDPKEWPGLHLQSALRVTDMSSFGTLRGAVVEALVTDDECTNDLAAQTGNAVYVYQGMTDTPGDIGDASNDPFVTATVVQDCQANNDGSDADDDIAFTEPQSFMIENGVTTELNF